MVNLADRLLCVKLHERSFYLRAVEVFLSVNFQFSRSFFGEIDQAKFYFRNSGIIVLKIKAKAKSFEFPQSPNKIYFFIKLHKNFPLQSRPCCYLKITLFVESLCKEQYVLLNKTLL